jgi:hypothetical protein
VVAHFFYEHRRPLPREIAPCATCRKESNLRLEPKRLLTGAQSFFLALYTRSAFAVCRIANSSNMAAI